MRIHADFSQQVIVRPDQHRWVPSPQPGVERVMLDRIGDEKARATSLVRYAPQSRFPGHQHPGGEEILVLSGTFSEAGTDHPAGVYLRNPPGSAHQPYTDEGALLFVKLWQMHPQEDRQVRIDTRDPAAWQRNGPREICPLFSGFGEHVSLQKLPPHERLFDGAIDSAELLVLAGEVCMADQSYGEGSWIRLPAGSYPSFAAGWQGLCLYVKTGHLPTAASNAAS